MSMNVFLSVNPFRSGSCGYTPQRVWHSFSDIGGKLQDATFRLLSICALFKLYMNSTSSYFFHFLFGGEYRSRTDDLLLAKQAL
jgi:hypothetical protein